MVNYDFPLAATGVEDYVHRIGRTARGNKKGSSYTFFTQRDGRLAGELSQLLARCRQVRSILHISIFFYYVFDDIFYTFTFTFIFIITYY